MLPEKNLAAARKKIKKSSRSPTKFFADLEVDLYPGVSLQNFAKSKGSVVKSQMRL
tara:strand:+ start:567 stop:734 length:168 start_codon:yes stop_codon:yes gene_type:complete